jgi:hypothetical protein
MREMNVRDLIVALGTCDGLGRTLDRMARLLPHSEQPVCRGNLVTGTGVPKFHRVI